MLGWLCLLSGMCQHQNVFGWLSALCWYAFHFLPSFPSYTRSELFHSAVKYLPLQGNVWLSAAMGRTGKSSYRAENKEFTVAWDRLCKKTGLKMVLKKVWSGTEIGQNNSNGPSKVKSQAYFRASMKLSPLKWGSGWEVKPKNWMGRLAAHSEGTSWGLLAQRPRFCHELGLCPWKVTDPSEHQLSQTGNYIFRPKKKILKQLPF